MEKARKSGNADPSPPQLPNETEHRPGRAGPPSRRSMFRKSFALLLLPSLFLLLLFMFSIFFILAPRVKSKFLDQRREETMNLAMLAANVVSVQRKLEESGQKSRKAAQEETLDRIDSLRYGTDGSGYFWIIDERGVLLAHPAIPSMVGKLPAEVDPPYREAYRTVSEMCLEIQASGKSGFMAYAWPVSPDMTERQMKTSYMLYYAPWRWVIGTGLFMDKFSSEVDRFLIWIVIIGICLWLASFSLSFFSAYRLTEYKFAIQLEKSRLDESQGQTRAKEEQFETIFNTSLLGITIVRADTLAFVRVNEAFARLSGFSAEELIGHTAIELGLFDDAEMRKLSAHYASEGGGAAKTGTEALLTIQTKTGEPRTVSLSPVIIRIGGALHAVTVYADVTESKRLQEHLAQSRKMETVGQLAGGIAHDFNNMLTGILGSAEILHIKLENRPEELKFVDIIMNAAQRASELTSKLLAFSRRGKIVSTSIDVHDSIRAAIGLLERGIDKKITIKAELKAAESMITGDPALIQNALLNIGLNARDAMPDGGTIVFSTRDIYIDEEPDGASQTKLAKGAYIEIAIRDTGTGIPNEIMPKIFDPFFTTKPVGQGTGLGLPAVYGTVKEHQGNVSVSSEIGQGTEFKIQLPLSAGNPGGRIEAENAPVKGSGRILLIDDESIIRNTVFGMLTGLGYSVNLAEDGEAGIRIYRENKGKIDLVILDMVMPGLSGQETYVRLKGEFPDVQVIFSSGFNPDAITSEVRKLGAMDFIRKPFRMSELSALVSSRIGKKA